MESASKMLVLFSCPKEVSITPYLSKDQIAAAREMDLLTYLRRFEPQELVHIGGDTYATRTHDSLKISNGKWCWWSRNIGGTNALDYLTRVEGLSFLDAVQRILGELPRVPTKSEPTAPLPKTKNSPSGRMNLPKLPDVTTSAATSERLSSEVSNTSA